MVPVYYMPLLCYYSLIMRIVLYIPIVKPDVTCRLVTISLYQYMQ